MRTLWNIVSFLAVVHVLALLMVAAWLVGTRRVSHQRVQGVRDLFKLSVVNAEAQQLEAQRKTEADRQAQIELQQRATPALDSLAHIQEVSRLEHHKQQSLQRLENEKDVLLEQLTAASALLDQKRLEFQQERNQWDAAVQVERQRKDDEQFQQAVRQYEQVPPKQGKRMIMELVSQNQIQIAVAYLDAMNPRAASKVLREFKTDSEIILATQLLEKLRMLGKTGTPEATGTSPIDPLHPYEDLSSDADDLASANSPGH